MLYNPLWWILLSVWIFGYTLVYNYVLNDEPWWYSVTMFFFWPLGMIFTLGEFLYNQFKGTG